MAEAVTRIEKENVILQVGDCAVTLLPQFGGKVASILVKGHELLQTPLVPYGPRTRTMGFNEGDASGWDECLPTVSGCTVQTVNGPVERSRSRRPLARRVEGAFQREWFHLA